MGRSSRRRPQKLPEKLAQIRQHLRFSQVEMAERLQTFHPGLQPGHISEFESGKREPSLLVLFEYARLSGLSTDLLIDDTRDLPKKFQRQ